MTDCKQCRHRKWIQINPYGGHWAICKCLARNLCFGLEIDVYENKNDKKRGIDAMPDKCFRFEKIE